MFICRQCGSPCDVVEEVEQGIEEFWGQRAIMESIYLKSDCHGADVDEECQEVYIQNWASKTLREYVLEHGQFPTDLATPLVDPEVMTMEELCHVLDDEELAHLTRLVFTEERKAA